MITNILSMYLINDMCKIFRWGWSLEFLHAEQGWDGVRHDTMHRGHGSCDSKHQHQGQHAQIITEDKTELIEGYTTGTNISQLNNTRSIAG